jgi:hypothetical protein
MMIKAMIFDLDAPRFWAIWVVPPPIAFYVLANSSEPSRQDLVEFVTS